MTPFVRPLSIAAVLALVASGAGAQTPAPDQGPLEPPPAHVAMVDGSVALERGSQSDDAVNGSPLLVGDRLRADSGHVEVMWAEGTLLKLGRYTDLDVLSKTMIRVTRGRVTITVPNLPGQVVNERLVIDAPGASVRFYSPGIYTLLVTGDDEPEVQLGVTHGSAQLISDAGQMTLADAESSEVKGGGMPSQPEHFLASVADSTYDPTPDLAVFQSASGTGEGYASTNYLPQDLYGYEDVLQSSGSWSSVPTYGYVWFPRVAAGWRPYYHGHWSYLPRYGWTWIGNDRFAWPTHYYGRWGVTSQGAWYWIPSKTWGPAWVAWSISPEYVGWCPLGWNGRAVYSFASVTTGTGNNFRGSDTFRGWTMVGSRNFGYHDIPHYVVERSVVLRDRPAFVTQYSSPRAPTYIVERGNGGGNGSGRTRTGGSRNGSRRVDAAEGAVPRGGVTGPSVRTTPPATSQPPGNSNPYAGVVQPTPEESPYDRALRVMGRRTREQPKPDGMSGDDQRDAGGNDGRSTVAPVLRKDGGTVRPPSGMSGPPGVYAPSRTVPGRGTQSQPAQSSSGSGNATSSGSTSSGNSGNSGSGNATSGGAAHRNGSSGSSSSKASSKDSNDNSSGSSGSSGSSSSSSGNTGKSSDNNSSSGASRRRP
jgi:hypothetical protein